MITKELIQRINELARKQRAEGLTPEEKKEQQELRNLYLKGIRSQIVDTLEASGLKPGEKHNGACDCEHCSADKAQAEDKNDGSNKEPGPGKLLH
ncbi:MAG: DUF896 domain-containing protein [Desulfotomaculaceae bacterium]|nr:DUF896 domain-containing protein [Desulfotomaculaceae bacterium]